MLLILLNQGGWVTCPVFLDNSNNKLTINDELHALSKNEVLLLEYLYKHAGEVIPRDSLLSICWPGRVVSPGSLPVAIKHVRDVLRKASSNEIIITHKNAGYSLQPNCIELIISPHSHENKTNEIETNQENHVERRQSLQSTRVHELTVIHQHARSFMSIAIIVVMFFLLVMMGGGIISFADEKNHNTIITNVPPEPGNSTVVFPSEKNALIFKDNFGSTIVCKQEGCQWK